MAWFALAAELVPELRKGNLDLCIDRTVSTLKSMVDCPFQIASQSRFTTSPTDVARYFDAFISEQSRLFDLKAVYAEMNGFDINPDRWFFSLFAYDTYGGHEDYDWLSDWNSEFYPEMTLTGMEPLQEAYASEAFRNEALSEAVDYASLLVVLRFQDLIRRSAAQMKTLKTPLLATAHEYDFIYEFRP
jgi:hypothetical protein